MCALMYTHTHTRGGSKGGVCRCLGAIVTGSVSHSAGYWELNLEVQEALSTTWPPLQPVSMFLGSKNMYMFRTKAGNFLENTEMHKTSISLLNFCSLFTLSSVLSQHGMLASIQSFSLPATSHSF